MTFRTPRRQIAAVFQDSRGQVFGSELVLSYTQMKKLFAPGVITQVLDFLIGCYCSTLGKRPWATENLTYVTYARAARTAEIEVALVAETARRFLVTAKVNSLHLTWSRNLQTVGKPVFVELHASFVLESLVLFSHQYNHFNSCAI